MKIAASVITTNPDSLRLLLALKHATEKPVDNFKNIGDSIYQGLAYLLNKEDEFDKTLYWEEDEEDESEDESDSEEENAKHNYGADYEFDYHRHK